MSKKYTIIYDTGDDSVKESHENPCEFYGSLHAPLGCFGTDDDPNGKTLATQFSDFVSNEYDPITQADIDACTTVAACKSLLQKICDTQKLIS
jgi:hypothetical protein